MNKGVWFSSPQKIGLTIVNIIILGIAIAIVSLSSSLYQVLRVLSLTNISAGWDSTCLESPFTITPVVIAGPAPTTSEAEEFPYPSRS